MCGIGGIMMYPATRTSDEIAYIRLLAEKIAVENQVRGRDATGFATFAAGKSAQVFKHPTSANKLVDTTAWKNFSERHITASTNNIMIHTRAGTKGSETNNLNNHPIESRRYIGVHNGIINNDDELFKSENLYRTAQVDSEVIFRLLDMQGEHFTANTAKVVAEKLTGMFTVAVVPKNRPSLLSIIRNDNPVTLVYIPTLNIVAFSSLRYHLTAAIRAANVDSEFRFYVEDEFCAFVEPPRESIWVFDTNSNNPIEQLNQTPVKFTERPRFGNSSYYVDGWDADDWEAYMGTGYRYAGGTMTKKVVKDYTEHAKQEESKEPSLADILGKIKPSYRDMILKYVDLAETLAWTEGWAKGRQSLGEEMEHVKQLKYEEGYDSGFTDGFTDGYDQYEKELANNQKQLALPSGDETKV